MDCRNDLNQPQCLRCRSPKVKRDGVTFKGAKRYFCHDCGSYWQTSYLRRPKDWYCMDQRAALFRWASAHPEIQAHLFTVTQLPSALKSEAIPLDQNQRGQCAVLLAYPTALYHGLWINLYHKPALSTEVPLVSQPWMQALQAAGYAVSLSDQWQKAVNDIEDYLN